jgi:hypothetical protein
VSACVRSYYLPGIERQIATETRQVGGTQVEVARLDPTHLPAVIERLRAAGRRLCRRSAENVLASIDRIVTNWLQPDYHLRRVAEELLPAATGFSPQMIRHGLPLLLEPLRSSRIRALLEDEFRDARVLDGVCAGRRALGPALITHVMSGNIPGLAFTPMLLSLALKSAVLIKSAAGDPISAALLAESIAEVDPELGQCVAVAHWHGGDRGLEEIAFGGADLVVASGSDAAVAAIAACVPGRFIGHGHKISFAAIGSECLDDRAAVQHVAHQLAYDVSLWDQQGCLSPQLCYVETGGRVTPAEFAELLGDALAHLATELPPRRLSLDERAAVLRFRQEAEWGQAEQLLASTDSTHWSISIEPTADFVPSCLNRCIRLKIVASLAELPATLGAHRRHLEAAGIAVAPQRHAEVADMLAGCGVHRICPIGTMQRPPLSWRQSGRPRVADWVEWTGVEKREA